MTEVVTEENQGASVGVTLKAGSGFSAPWVTLRGENAAEVEALTDQLHESQLLQKVAQLGAVFGKLWTEHEPAPKPAPQAQAAQPAQQAAAPSGGAHSRGDVHPTQTCTVCGGQVSYVKQGTSTRGTYHLWSCGNRDHKPVFTNN